MRGGDGSKISFRRQASITSPNYPFVVLCIRGGHSDDLLRLVKITEYAVGGPLVYGRHGLDLFQARPFELSHGSKTFEELDFSPFADAGDVIQRALQEPARTEVAMSPDGRLMRLVTNAHQHVERDLRHRDRR